MADAVSVSSNDSGPECDYETVRESILQCLDDVEGPSSFAYASEVTTAPNPGLNVDGIGAVGLPLSDRDAKELISKCRQSPFGKGGDTIVDTEVRNSFELNPSEFTLSNPAWNVCVNALVDIVYRELALNCGRQHVVPELYKLLLYEQGAFFRSHQDSEKTPGMFGTLVVCLPSDHQGGTVVLKHQKDEYNFNSSKSAAFGTTFAAWYSDVFHEVQKVTGGRRLVLTYNLVQKGSSIKPRAPDSDGTTRLTQSLQEYNRSVEANCSDFPNFLAYSLEHTYSQAGLSLSALKGADFSRVDSLKGVCDKIGFDLYLALKEKCIDKDDDCGSEEFDRHESFKYVHDLEGRSQGINPQYDSINLLDEGAATDDEEADESEHEGWTGNEGAPAHYWYRTSMVLIVPPSRRVDFCLDTSESNFAAISKLTKEYSACRPAADSYEAQQLNRACKLSISKISKQGIGYSPYSYRFGDKDDGEQKCMEEVARVTLERDWYGMYTNIPSKWRLTASALEALGAYLASHEYDAGKWKELEALLQKADSLQAQLEALQSLQKGTKTGSTPEEAKDWVHDTGRMILNKTLESSVALRKNVGETIADVFVDYGLQLHDAVLAALQKCPTPTVATFMLRVAASVSDDGNDPRKELLEKVTKQLWTSSFELEGPEIRTRLPYSFVRGEQYSSERDSLTADELIGLLEVTQQHSSMPAFDVLPILRNAFPKVSAQYAKDHLWPMLEKLIKRKVDVLLPHNTRTPNDTVTEFIKAGLTAVITNHILPEPQRPKNFALPCGPCNCSDCRYINDFLVSQQLQYRFPCAKKRRAHLHSQFTDKGSGMYDVTTLATGNPHVWQITKTFDKKYRSDHAAWTLRVKWLTGELNKLAKFQGGLLTEDMLGKETYRAIMGCTVESLKSVEGGRALMEASGNARKRKSGDSEDQNAKKARGMSWPGGVEVVDLT